MSLQQLPDKIPVIIHDKDEKSTHHIFARRPKPNEPAYHMLISFTLKDGAPIKHRLLIDHQSLIKDIAVKGRFVIENETSNDEQDIARVSKLLMKEALKKQVEEHGRSHKTKNFQHRKSRLSTLQAGGGKYRFSTRKVKVI